MSFTKKKTLDESLKIIRALVQVCCKKGGHICQRLSKMFDEADYLGIIDYQFDYHSLPIDRDDVLYARQIQALLSKQDFLDLGVDKEAAAIDKFLHSEELCRETNRRFRTDAPTSVGVRAVLHYSRRKVAEILGDVPDISELHFCFGPGTNTSTSMGDANSRIKLSSSLECGQNMEPFARAFLNECPNWLQAHVNKTRDLRDLYGFSDEDSIMIRVAHGVLRIVAKTCKIGRAIIQETIINGFYQKGIGLKIRELLLTNAGLDLRDQQPNQRFAQKGSEFGEIATLDLVGASDTVAYGYVLDQLPLPWFQFLEIGRTPTVIVNGKEVELQKFSSMGNAYTFELESLLFYCLAYGVCEHLHLDQNLVRSYGDDIIVPTAAVPLMKEVLSYCGFELNREKSYWDGPFRESCGADYLFGTDIRPFYLKSIMSERILYLMHNWFVRHCEWELAATVLSFVRLDEALWGPDGYGDGHLVGHYTLRTSRKLLRLGYSGGVFDTYTAKKKHNYTAYFGDWVYPSYSIYARFGVSENEYELDEDGLIVSESTDKITQCVIPSKDVDPNTVRGLTGYKKISIYTLATTIFGRVSQSDWLNAPRCAPSQEVVAFKRNRTLRRRATSN